MIRIDASSPVPIYDQIKSGLRGLVAKGILKPGDAAPSIRELSAKLKVNPNTVARAFRELSVEGFFDSRRDQAGSSQRYGMEIVGSEGILSLRGGSGSELMVYPHPVFRPAAADQAWEPVTGLGDDPLATGNELAIADLIAAAESDREPLSSARDAVAALEMILGAYASQITGRRVAMPMAVREHPLLAWRAGRLP
ncbi:MAG: GntR family transcriptional regulator [Elusimicrobiota bacterium]